jgi:ribosomal protein S18 acetylase RimI-like enzyme
VNDIAVKPLVPALSADFLRFFDHERGAAFSDNPEWAKCYCHFYQVPREIDWALLSAEENRVAMASRIEVGAMQGFLAYRNNDIVGWLNAQPRHMLSHCFGRLRIAPTPLPCEPYEAALIVCFVVSPSCRRCGVARTLLVEALRSLGVRGFKVVDAFPFKTAHSELPADHYHGPLSLFLSEGFSVLREEESMTVVRKVLTSS